LTPLPRSRFSPQVYLGKHEVRDRDEAGKLADAVASLLKENNFKVEPGGRYCSQRHAMHFEPLFLERRRRRRREEGK
jgi:hypothetical protein